MSAEPSSRLEINLVKVFAIRGEVDAASVGRPIGPPFRCNVLGNLTLARGARHRPIEDEPEEYVDLLLRPIPFQAVPVSRAAEAFRTMQQSKHIGKIAISLRSDAPQALAVLRTEVPVRGTAPTSLPAVWAASG